MKSGFTMPEVIIASTIAAVISGLLIVIMVNSTGLFYQESSRVNQGVKANDSLGDIRDTLRQSSSIASQYPESGVATFTSGSTQVVFKIPSIDSSGGLIVNTFDYIIYYLSSDKLYKQTYHNNLSSRKDNTQVLTINVSNFLLQYFDSGGNQIAPNAASKVKATLTLSQISNGKTQIQIATSEGYLRND